MSDRRVWAWCCSILLAACSGGGDGGGRSSSSGGPGGDAGPEPCQDVRDCDDGLYCNGQEACAPEAVGADARGCLAGPLPCDGVCDEAGDRCVERCPDGSVPDADGDGYPSIACGGTDCDDDDGNRFPGNAEVCDADGHDEDCDPETFGFRDTDRDGYVSAECCNTDSGGTMFCGDDCADMSDIVFPTATELCDGRDNDCDSLLDEDVFEQFFRDADGDGFGDPTAPIEHACTDTHDDADNGFDCDDGDPDVRPGAAELCDGRDNNCDGLFERDLDRDGHLEVGSVCTGGDLPVDDCNDFLAVIYGGAPEACDALDNDCDGASDERVDADATCAVNGVDAGFCLAASCRTGSCEAGRADCNDRDEDGCEVDTDTDDQHCGACGVVCPYGEACTDGFCDRPVVTELALGASHTCGLSSTGGVACWGANADGQSGRLSRARALAATPSPNLSGATALAAGDSHTCALAADGTVTCYGRNNVGQLGRGSRDAVVVSGPVRGLSGAVAIDANNDGSCAVDASGALFCWGFIWAANDSVEAVEVSGDRDASQGFGVGFDHLCAQDAMGAWCMGFDNLGQLGTSASLPECSMVYPSGFPAVNQGPCSSTPISVEGAPSYPMLATGSGMNCGATGYTVNCWGDNRFGELRLPPPATLDTPLIGTVRAEDGDPWVSIAASRYHLCLERESGQLDCWGWNDFGQLGDGTTDSSELDRTVTGGPAVLRDVAVGVRHSCAIDDAGEPWCWGDNGEGQLGDRSLERRPSPARVMGLERARRVFMSGGDGHVITADGRLRNWQSGTTGATLVDGVERVLMGTGHGGVQCIIDAEGVVTCWGRVDEGGLGVGPTTIGQVVPRTALSVPPARSVSLSAEHGCVVAREGTVHCWGTNESGAVGDGTTERRDTPVQAVGIDEIVEVSVGGGAYSETHHTCALRRDGRVFCVGDGSAGQLGDGLSLSSLTWVEVEGIDDATAIHAGSAHTCALRSDGTVWCWGLGLWGQLGRGPAALVSATPEPVLDLEGVVQISGADNSTCARLRSGSVTCWGDTTFGQLGAPTAETNGGFTPHPVEGLVALELGSGVSAHCAIDASSALICWGATLPVHAGITMPGLDGRCEPDCVVGFFATDARIPGI